jgi:hypothetical protein
MWVTNHLDRLIDADLVLNVFKPTTKSRGTIYCAPTLLYMKLRIFVKRVVQPAIASLSPNQVKQDRTRCLF